MPRVNTVSQPPVDVHAAAVEIARESGWPIVAAVGLPEGWTATSARYVRTTDGFMTWHAGYQPPDGTYVAVEQTMDATPRLGRGADQPRPPKAGTSRPPARTWTTFERGHQGAEQPARTTRRRPATSRPSSRAPASFEEMADFADDLQPVAP